MNVSWALAPELTLPLFGVAVNQVADGVPTVQFKPSPTVSVRVITCDGGLLPCVAVKDRPVVLSYLAGAAMLMVIATVAGLPAVAWPVDGSMALTIMLVVNVWPPGTPLASTITSVEVFAPPARFEPEVTESETKDGPSEARAALQFNGKPPEFPIVIDFDDVPVVPLSVSEVGLTMRSGGVVTFSVIVMTWGVPTGLLVTLSFAMMVTVPV